MKTNETKDKCCLLLAMVVFGTIGLFRRAIPYPSSVIALVRGAVGALFLMCVHLLGKKKLDRAAVKRQLPLLLLSGALIGANWVCLFEAYRYTDVSVATVCYYMAPVFVVLASPLVMGERLTTRKALCALFAVGGMVLVSGAGERSVNGLTGILFGLAAAIMYACVVLLNKKITGLSAGDRTLFQLAAAALAVLPYVLATENISSLQPDPLALVLLLTLGVVHTGMAYALYFGAMGGLKAQTIALLSYLDPIVAVLLSVLLLGERLSLLGWLGAAVVLGAMLISELPGKKA